MNTTITLLRGSSMKARALIPFAALGALVWLVDQPVFRHATHDAKIRLAVGVLVPFILLEMFLSFRAGRKKAKKPARPVTPYAAAPARRR